MSFNSNIPRATDLISVSQGDLFNNFSSMQTTYSTDHYGFNPITNIGLHKHVTMPNDPGNIPTPSIGFGAIYAVTSNSQTYPQYQRDATNTIYSLMPIKAYAAFALNAGAASLFSLPYGNVSSITAAGNVFTINFIDPFPNKNYSALISVEATGVLANVINAQKLTGSCQIFTNNASGNIVMIAFIN